MGARSLTLAMPASVRRWNPLGAFRAPLIIENKLPPANISFVHFFLALMLHFKF